MGISIELVITTVIVGMLILMVGKTNQTMTESRIENRLTYEMQERAINVQQFLEVELRKVKKVITENDSLLVYKSVSDDTIKVYKDRSELIVENKNTGDKSSIAARLSELKFTYLPNSAFVTVSLTTKSRKKDSSGGKSEYLGFSERRYFLRNLN